jgi:hypothetical protein
MTLVWLVAAPALADLTDLDVIRSACFDSAKLNAFVMG